MLFFKFKNENETKYIFFLRDKKKRNVRSQKKLNVDIPTQEYRMTTCTQYYLTPGGVFVPGVVDDSCWPPPPLLPSVDDDVASSTIS